MAPSLVLSMAAAVFLQDCLDFQNPMRGAARAGQGPGLGAHPVPVKFPEHLPFPVGGGEHGAGRPPYLMGPE
jgi:hypothetical protein